MKAIRRPPPIVLKLTRKEARVLREIGNYGAQFSDYAGMVRGFPFTATVVGAVLNALYVELTEALSCD